ncbi:hypothetical protein AKUA1404_05810 [Apilactobacillus kunkeei]|nr:hypothetical protein AKUA1404_05810 [Apilactobacillus kunkeei]
MLTIRLYQKNKRAFTTIEMLIVLIISTFFMSLSIFLYDGVHVNDKELEEEFWTNFKVYWRRTIETNEYKHVSTQIYVDGHDVVFYNFRKHVRLRMPNSLSVQPAFLIMVNSDGYSAPQTYEWFSKKTNTRYLLKVQLGGGTYKLYEKYYE